MDLVLKPFRKKNVLYFYVEDQQSKTCVDVVKRLDVGSLTQKQKMLLGYLVDVLEATEPVYRGKIDFGASDEQHSDLAFNFTIAITDIAEIGNIKVESDGAYLYSRSSGNLWYFDDVMDKSRELQNV